VSESGTRSGLGTNDRDQRAVQDILDFCEQAARLVARGHDAFESDEMLRLAAEALAQRVGEAVSRLSKASQDQHPAVPWRAMRGMRNLVVHDYGWIDDRVLWNTLTLDFPTLAEELRRTAIEQ
jgi:uncharacterized protein with HEPN domain